MWNNFCQALSAGINLFLPPVCPLCGQLLSPEANPRSFCSVCRSDMPPLGKSNCSRCAQPFPASSSQHLCATCLKRPTTFTDVYAACSYQDRVKEAIQRLKYRNQINLAQPLGHLLGESMATSIARFEADCIVPVPLHVTRLKERGYNQALEISRPLALRLEVPIETGLLKRTLKTPPQQGLTATERKNNLRNAFKLGKTNSARSILLVDDVMTTGETVRECCRVLLQGKVEEVRVAVIGRA